MENLRDSGIDIIGKVLWGTHFCQFYQTKKDLLDLLVPYFKTGLQNNEFCMWVTADPLKADEAKSAMKKAIPNFEKYLKSGQIVIIPYDQWYTKGGGFDEKRVLAGWVEKHDKALKAGFAGLRLSGNTFWLEKKDWKAFTDYEEEINNVIGKYNMIGLCTYSLEKCGVQEVIDVIKNHQFALVRQDKEWEKIEGSTIKRLSNGLKKNEEKLSYLASFPQLNPNPIIEIGSNSDIVYMNTAAEELFGKEMKKENKLIAGIKFKRGNSVEREMELNGRVWIQSILRLPNGNIRIYHKEITKRKMAENALIRAEKDWRLTFDSDPDMIAILDNQHRIVRANRAMTQRLKTTVNKCVGLTCFSCVHGADKPPKFCPLTLTLKDKKEHIAEVYEERLGGYFIVSTTPLFDDDGTMVGSVHVARDITERKKIENSLRESQHDLSHAQEVAHVGSWRLDVRNNRLIWSDEAYRMFGIPKGKLTTNKIFFEKVHPEDRDLVHNKWQEALLSKSYDVEHRIIVDGKIKWVRELAELELDKKGKLVGSFGTVRDITDYKELNRRKDIFISIASHELKTPITSMKIFSQITQNLLKKKADPKVLGYLSRIEVQIDKMTNLINDLLDVSRIQSGKLVLRQEKFSLLRLIHETVGLFEKIANNHKIVIEGQTKDKIFADRSRIGQVLINLLSNATHYSPEGSQITIKLSRKGNNLVVSIKDQGIGIAKEHLGRIFDSFYRIYEDQGRNIPGLGMGLYISSEIIKAHNGKIWVKSEKGKGSTFYFSLPVK